MALRSVGVRLQAEISNYVTNMRRAGATARGFAAELDKAARAGKLNAVADQAGRMGLALEAGFLLAVGAAARFEKQMSQVQAATRAGAAEMQALSQAAIAAGKDTAFSATEAAQGIEELAKAGVSTADILAGGLQGALDLAAAGQVEVGEAAETAASAMTQFGLTGSQMTHVADLLAAGAGKAQGSVSDMASALNQSGLVAAQAGLTIEETTGALAAFASAGLLGSDAGTSFKTMLQRLAAPTGEAAALMDELGISAYDVNGQFVGMAEFAGGLRDALSDLSQQQRLATLNTIFGTDAIRAASITYEQGEAGIQGWIDQVDEAGYASETAAAKTDNLIGDVERLTGELESLAIESGGGVTKGLRLLVQSLEAVVAQFGQLPPVVTGGITAVAGISGVALLGFSAWVKLRDSVADALTELEKVGPISGRVAGGLRTATKWAGRAAAAFTALQIASAVAGALGDAAPEVDKLADSLGRLGDTGLAEGEFERVFGSDWAKRFTRDLNMAGQGLDNLRNAAGVEAVVGLNNFSWSNAHALEQVEALDEALAQLHSSGNTEQAKRAFDELAKVAEKEGKSTEFLVSILPRYKSAVQETTRAMDPFAREADAIAERNEALASTWTEAAAAAGALAAKFDELNDEALTWAEAEIDLARAFDDAREAIGDNGKTLDVNTEAGRENREALLAIARATREATQARLDDSDSVSDAIRTYEDARAQFIDIALAMGQTREAAEDLADQWLAMPPTVQTKVSTPGLSQALSRINAVNAALAKAGGELRIRTSVGGYHVERWGGVTTHAASGALREAATYTPQAPARYAFAEPATGGEAFVPRNGNRGRSLGILATAAGWYGHDVVPRGRMQSTGGGSVRTVVVEHRHTLTIDGTGMVSGLRDEIRLFGNGDPVEYLRG